MLANRLKLKTRVWRLSGSSTSRATLSPRYGGVLFSGALMDTRHVAAYFLMVVVALGLAWGGAIMARNRRRRRNRMRGRYRYHR
jgi:hypothetical protein